MVCQYEISELEKEKNALEQRLETLRKKFDTLRQEQGNYPYYGRTFSELCELESQLKKVNQELDKKYTERSECDSFVKKHGNTFRSFKDNYTNGIAYFKKSVRLSNMLFIMFAFAFGIGLLAAFLSWFENESIVISLICIALMTALCVVAYIVCKKYIDKYCTHLAKEDSDTDIQRTVNQLIQQDKCQELKSALLEAGLMTEYDKIEKKYENISKNIRSNDDFRNYCKFPPPD